MAFTYGTKKLKRGKDKTRLEIWASGLGFYSDSLGQSQLGHDLGVKPKG